MSLGLGRDVPDLELAGASYSPDGVRLAVVLSDHALHHVVSRRDDDVAGTVLQGARDLTGSDVVERLGERAGGDALAVGGAGDSAAVQSPAEQVCRVPVRGSAAHAERDLVTHVDEVDQADVLELRRRGLLRRAGVELRRTGVRLARLLDRDAVGDVAQGEPREGHRRCLTGSDRALHDLGRADRVGHLVHQGTGGLVVVRAVHHQGVRRDTARRRADLGRGRHARSSGGGRLVATLAPGLGSSFELQLGVLVELQLGVLRVRVLGLERLGALDERLGARLGLDGDRALELGFRLGAVLRTGPAASAVDLDHAGRHRPEGEAAHHVDLEAVELLHDVKRAHVDRRGRAGLGIDAVADPLRAGPEPAVADLTVFEVEQLPLVLDAVANGDVVLGHVRRHPDVGVGILLAVVQPERLAAPDTRPVVLGERDLLGLLRVPVLGGVPHVAGDLLAVDLQAEGLQRLDGGVAVDLAEHDGARVDHGVRLVGACSRHGHH